MEQTKCPHEDFSASVSVTRLTNNAGVVGSYMAEVAIQCTACKVLMRFRGLDAGYDPHHPKVNTDATEVRLPIEPALVTEILGRPARSGTA
jgi:hypothetical protein